MILGIFGVVFAFEAPRKAFIKLFRRNRESAGINSGPALLEDRASTNSNLDSAPSTERDSLNIAPNDIADKKDHLSEVEFDEYFNSFSGYIITWEGRIGTVSLKRGGQSVSMQIIFCNEKLRGFFDIRIKDYPNVKLFKSGDIAMVTGRIKSPNWPTFDLVDAKILKWTRKGDLT